MKPTHRLTIEALEKRLVLNGVGPFESGTDAALERVIVTLQDDVGDPASVAQAFVQSGGGRLGQVYQTALKGFSAELPAAAVAALSANPRVKAVEPDLIVQAAEQVLPTGVDRIDAELNGYIGTGGAVDVDIAIIDTGIDVDHPDLPDVVDGRHFWTVATGPPGRRGSFQDDNYDDDRGHGTHVAGIAAALDNGIGVVGVAPGARLWAVKVLDSQGSGYLSDVIAGVDWVTANASEIEVANMSLEGTGGSGALRTAIQNSVAAGVVYVVAAGNYSRDVYGQDGIFGTSDDVFPAAFPEVAAISALADYDGEPGGLYSGADDSFAAFTNYSASVVDGNPVSSPGAAIDLILPGVDIYSTYFGGGYATLSGTSMAAPHAAGLAALYIAEHGRATNAAGVYAIRQALIDGGVAQNSPLGLALLDDPDANPENLGWAGPQGPAAPRVFITQPTEGETVAGLVTITAEVIEVDGIVGQVEFFAGGNYVGLDTDGTNGWSVQWDTTTAADGPVTISATAVDGEGLTGEDQIAVYVDNDTGGASTIHVADLDATQQAIGQSGKWQARVTATIHDEDSQPVSGAELFGSWSDAGSTFLSVSGITGTDGTVTLASGTIRLPSVTFTVTNVEYLDWSYTEADNHDPEGDSDGTTIDVYSPLSSTRAKKTETSAASLTAAQRIAALYGLESPSLTTSRPQKPEPRIVDYLMLAGL